MGWGKDNLNDCARPMTDSCCKINVQSYGWVQYTKQPDMHGTVQHPLQSCGISASEGSGYCSEVYSKVAIQHLFTCVLERSVGLFCAVVSKFTVGFLHT
jgi:hypothetical protein